MPKTLYLVRHAKSDWHTGQPDFERPLNKRGLRDAPEMGKRLKSIGSLPDLILCSPAKRAVQTLENLDLGVERVVYKETIYEASIGDLLEIIQTLEDSDESAMLIGHNPAMTWLAAQLSGTGIPNLPTCSIVTLRLDSNHWNKAGTCPAELLNLDDPKSQA